MAVVILEIDKPVSCEACKLAVKIKYGDTLLNMVCPILKKDVYGTNKDCPLKQIRDERKLFSNTIFIEEKSE